MRTRRLPQRFLHNERGAGVSCMNEKRTGKPVIQHIRNLIYIAVAVFLAAGFRWAAGSAYNAAGDFYGHNFNLAAYAGIILAAFFLYLIFSALAGPVSAALEKAGGGAGENSALKKAACAALYIVYAAAALVTVYFILRIYLNETFLYPGTAAPSYLRQMMPHRLYFSMAVGIAAILFLTLRRDGRAPYMPYRLGLLVIFAFLNGGYLYCSNYFLDDGGGVIHIHAVTNTIVNVAQGAPFSNLNCSIYGHFALLCLPFVKLLGNNMHAVILTLCLCGAVSFAAAFYAASKIVKNDIVYLFTVLAVTGTTTILTRKGEYYQINPLRFLFPMLCLAYVSYRAAHREADRRLLAAVKLLLGVCAVIWNLETGLFVLVVLAGDGLFRAMAEEGLFSKRVLYAALREAVFCIISPLLSYLVCGLYNLSRGGAFGSVRLYIYPYLSGTYNVNNLRLAMPTVGNLFFFQIALFTLTIALAFHRFVHLRGGCGEEKTGAFTLWTIRFLVSVSGLLQLVYFMNRAAYGNMSIAHINMCILLGSYACAALDIEKKNLKEHLRISAFFGSLMSCIMFFGVVWMAIEGTLYISIAADIRAHSIWEKQTIDAMIADIGATVPEDTYAFGLMVPELYYTLGRDTRCHMTDWSDINDVNSEFALGGLEKEDAVFTSLDLKKNKEWELVKSWDFWGYPYRYYVRKK